MTERRRVLVTGSSGYIAAQLVPPFLDRYECTLVDIEAGSFGESDHEVHALDLVAGNADTIRDMFDGHDAVVHLAYVRNRADDDQEFAAEMDNVRMAHNVFRAARDAGVPRVVVASSNHAADFYEHLLRSREMEMLAPTNDIRPLSDNFYGWAKETYEHLGFVFATGTLGRPVENVHIRIGAPRPIEAATVDGDDLGFPYRRNLGAYISPRDMAQLFIRSIETEDIDNEFGIPWQVFYGISDNTRAFWSLANARDVIGYEPEDDSEAKWGKDIFEHIVQKEVIGRVGPSS